MYYASFGLLSIVIHLIINYQAMKKPRDGEGIQIRSRYRSFLFGVLLYYISDVLWGFLYEWKTGPFVFADTVLYFFSMGLTVFLWTRFTVAYLRHRSRLSDLLGYAGWAILLSLIVTLAVNFFYPVMFAFDQDGEYLPGKGRYILLAAQIILFVFTAIYTLIRAIRVTGQDRLHYRAIWLSGVVMTAFIVLQTLFPLLPFYAIGCLIASCVTHTFVEVDEKVAHELELGHAKSKAYKDALTNVRNVHAYNETKNVFDGLIKDHALKELGLIVFDVNDLKKVNDTKGHEAGDRYLQEACKQICNTFKHSPIFRIGGDEFIAVLVEADYQSRNELIAAFNAEAEERQKNGGAVVSAGLDIYDPEKDTAFDEIFERADRQMYERKQRMKAEA